MGQCLLTFGVASTLGTPKCRVNVKKIFEDFLFPVEIHR